MNNKRSGSISALFADLFRLLRITRESSKDNSHEEKTYESKYFSLMLGEFFNLFGNKDSDTPVDDDSGKGNSEEFEHNPMLDLLDRKSREAEIADSHEDSSGEIRNMWNSGEDGESLSDEEGVSDGKTIGNSEDGENDLNGTGQSKRARQNQHSRVASKMSSVVSEALVPECVVFNEIGEAKQIFDWRRILRQNSSYEVDWSYNNAVIEDGIVRPTLEAVPIASTEILLDTSGSIDEPLLNRFLQECKNILPYSKVRVGCFDTQFYGFKDIKSLKDLENMVFEGRHGTSFTAAVNAFSGRVDNRIIFTDGEASMPSVRMDVIWIVFGKKRIVPNGGRVFYVDDGLLKRLKSDM